MTAAPSRAFQISQAASNFFRRPSAPNRKAGMSRPPIMSLACGLISSATCHQAAKKFGFAARTLSERPRAAISALGILLALVAIRRHRAAEGTARDAAAAAATHLHTIPTSASGSGS